MEAAPSAIANPEARQLPGFIDWLALGCTQPLPEYLLNNIRASWDTRTYRSTLEAQMGQHHAHMSETAYTLMDLVFADDEEGSDLEEVRSAMALLRTPETRYYEAALLMGQGSYTAARNLIVGLPAEHDLDGRETLERSRMLTLIGFMEDVFLDGRTEGQLDPGEIAELQTFINVEHDRPTNWASHLLCYNYGICRSPYTGDADEAPKSLPQRVNTPTVVAVPRLLIKPNPANAWVVFTYDLPRMTQGAILTVSDMTGRVLFSEAISQTKGQVLMDTRSTAPGSYLVEVVGEGKRLLPVEKLIVRP